MSEKKNHILGEQNHTSTQVEVYGSVQKQIKNQAQEVLQKTPIDITDTEIKEVLKENEVKMRVTLLRHYPYNEETQENKKNISEYNNLLQQKFEGKPIDNERLSNLEKIVDALAYTSYDDIPDERIKQVIEASFYNCEETVLVYPIQGKQRVRKTGRDLLKKYKIKNRKSIKLTGSNKGDSLGNIYIDMSTMFKQEYSKLVKKYTNTEFKNIVIIGNRTYSYGMNFLSGNGNITIRQSEKGFESEGYIIHDYNTEGKLIPSNNQYISVTPENYNELKKVFAIVHSSITDFQNKLNVCFLKGTFKYEDYLSQDNEDLRMFCILKLLSDKENQDNIKKVIAYYSQVKVITQKEENILILNLDIIKIKKLYVSLSLKKKVTGKENIESLSKIFQIQYRSLDSQIRKQDEKGILKRELHRITRTTNVTTGEVRYSYHDIDIDYILKSGGQKFVLPAHVGSGKSIWLSEFAKKVIFEYPEYSVHFFEGKDFNHQYDENSVTERFQELLANTDDSKIIYVDAIDEIIDTKTKKEILEMIQNSKNKIIITGRLSEFQEKYNDGFVTLGFQNISKEKFIEEKIDDEEKRKEILDFLEKSNLAQEVEGNPLLLNFVCILANLDDEKKQEYIKIGVKELQKINNKADLYESITRLVIFQHNVSKGYRIGKMELENSINNLSKKAFDVFSGVSIDNDLDENDLQKLSILFKKSGTGEYEFIHHSFYEFFLAKYLSSNNNGNQEIYNYRDKQISSGNWDSWKSFQPVVLFYGEIIRNNNDTQIIIDLLSEKGLIKQDDIFSENFFLALNILSQLPEHIKKLSEFDVILMYYKSKVEKWDISEVMVKRVDYIKIFFDCIGDSNNIIGDEIIGKILLFLEEKESEVALRIPIIGTLSDDEIGYTINIYEDFQAAIILFSQILNPILLEKIFGYMKKYEYYINDMDIDKIYSGIQTHNKKIQNMMLESLRLYKEFVFSSKKHSHRIMSMYVLFLSINPDDKEALDYLTTYLKSTHPFLMDSGDISIGKLLKIDISKENELYSILHKTDKKSELLKTQKTLGKEQKTYVLSREEILGKIEKDFEITKKSFLLSKTQDKDKKHKYLMNAYSFCAKIIMYGKLDFIEKTILLIIEHSEKSHINMLQRVFDALGHARNSYTKGCIIEWINDSLQNANLKEKYVFYHLILKLGNEFSKREAAIWLLSNAQENIKSHTKEFYYIYMVLLDIGDNEFEVEAREWILSYIERLFLGEKRNFTHICYEVLKIENIQIRKKIIPFLYQYSEQITKNGNLKDAQKIYNKLSHLGIYISGNGDAG